MKTRTRRYAKRQLTWMRKLPGVQTIDVTGREAQDVAAELHGMIIGRMRFEKWQALGNDYLIVEADGLEPERVRALCDRHRGVGRRRRARARAARRARLRGAPADLQPGRLRGRAVGQRRAPGAALPARARLDGRSLTYSIQTLAGEIRATITGEHSCRTDMGRATLEGEGELDGLALPAHPHRQPADRDPGRRRATSRDTRPGRDRAADRDARAIFPNRTNVSFWTELAPDRIRARIFERGVGETQSSGTGACGAAVAHVLRGGDSPVTVELDGGELTVDVDESLHVDLEGWAVPSSRARSASVTRR